MGSVLFAKLLQVPTLPATLQAWHSEPHAVLQQTPSTQFPDRHWLAPEHTVPLVFLATQAPEAQYASVQHCASAVQLFRQAVAPALHLYGQQLVVPESRHNPVPLQKSGVCNVKSEHV